jgi:hypothetical protein
MNLARTAVLVQVFLANGFRLGSRGVPNCAADVVRMSVSIMIASA